MEKGWKYYTKINPYNDKPNDPLSKALELFIKDLLLTEEEINEIKNTKKFIINTNGSLNNIEIGMNVFNKDRFLSSRKFKQKLIDYYNSHGIFVRGPKEIIKSDNTTTGTWIIELIKISKNDNTNYR